MAEHDEGQQDEVREQLIKLLEDQDAKSMLVEGLVGLIKPALVAEVQEQARKEAEGIVPELVAKVSAAQRGHDLGYEGDEGDEPYGADEGEWGPRPSVGTPRFQRRPSPRTPQQAAAERSFRELRARMRPLPDLGSELVRFDAGTGPPTANEVTVRGRRATVSGANLHGVRSLAVDDVEVPDFVVVNSRRIEFEVPLGVGSGACVAINGSDQPTEEIELEICTTTGEEY
jgi:hypothetical protein